MRNTIKNLGWEVTGNSNGSITVSRTTPLGDKFQFTVEPDGIGCYVGSFDREKYSNIRELQGNYSFKEANAIIADSRWVEEKLTELAEAVKDKPAVRIVFEDIGEGYGGDYNAQDPEDEKLLRMTAAITLPGEDAFADIPGASVCTRLPVGTDEALLSQAATTAAELVEGLLNAASDEDYEDSFPAIVKLMEYLSWADPKRPTPIPSYAGKDVDQAMRRAALTGPSGRMEAYRILTEYEFPLSGMDVDDLMDRWEDDSGY